MASASDEAGSQSGGRPLPNEFCHDLLNLLFIIQGRVEVVLLELDAEDPHRQDFLEVYRACVRAVALTESWRTPEGPGPSS
jgi:hypothetical protein